MSSRVEEIVRNNRSAIFKEENNDLRIVQLSVSRRLRRRDDRYHQVVHIRYATTKGMYRKKLWLKVRKGFEELYEIHCDLYKRLEGFRKMVPEPYFYDEGYRGGEGSVIGMEFVEGTSLQNILLRKAVCGGVRSLTSVFSEVGAGMRIFHDTSRSSGVKRVRELADNARRVTSCSPYLTEDQRRELVRHIEAGERVAGSGTELPLIKIHNDWILRNLLIMRNGGVRVVDLDSMRAPDNSRWYDLCYFLINVESQLKYWPVMGRAGLLDLWKSFWCGYSEKGLPEALSAKMIIAIMYLIKVEYLFGGTIRPPLFEIYGRYLGTVYLRQVKKSVIRGAYSMLNAEL
jgi:hypothetical protein